MNEDDLWKIIKEEFRKVKYSWYAVAEIPALRKSVCDRTSLSEEEFDKLVEKKWLERKCRLELGSPIGVRNVKYLRTSGGTRYFYISRLI